MKNSVNKCKGGFLNDNYYDRQKDFGEKVQDINRIRKSYCAQTQTTLKITTLKRKIKGRFRLVQVNRNYQLHEFDIQGCTFPQKHKV